MRSHRLAVRRASALERFPREFRNRTRESISTQSWNIPTPAINLFHCTPLKTYLLINYRHTFTVYRERTLQTLPPLRGDLIEPKRRPLLRICRYTRVPVFRLSAAYPCPSNPGFEHSPKRSYSKYIQTALSRQNRN